MPPAAPAHALADRVALIVEALCHAVARRIAPASSLAGLAGPLIILIVSRLRRFKTRFTRLATSTEGRFEAPRPPRLRRRVWVPLYPPRRFAWLLRLTPEAAPIAAQLRHLLAEPEMTALLASIPELRRTLRPLCQMLGIRPTPALRQTPATRATPALAAPPAAPGYAILGCATPSHAILPQPPPPIPPRPSPPFAVLRLVPMQA